MSIGHQDRNRIVALQDAVEADDPYLAEELQKIGSRLGELMSELDTDPDSE